MTKILNFALKIKGGGREGGTCEVLRPCHPPKIWNVHLGKNCYTVKIKKSKVSCSCKGFRFVKICSHSVAVGEKENSLHELVKGIKVSRRSALTHPNVTGGAGRKGKCQRRSRIYSVCPLSSFSTARFRM